MHDPMTVAFEIRRPWPQIRKHRSGGGRGARVRGAFWWFGRTEVYWPALITVWHNEPDGADSGTVCDWRSPSWRWHVHHWSLQFHPWQHFRRWAFTRCAWCNGHSRRGDYVNHGRGWSDDRKPDHWWLSDRGLYHADCISIEDAHNECLCAVGVGMWDSGGVGGRWGHCGVCGGFRAYRYSDGPRPEDVVRAQANALLRTIPYGQRDPAISAAVSQIWRDYRDSTAA